MSFFDPESTSSATENIDDILQDNMERTHGERIAREGSIGPTPSRYQFPGGLTEEDLLDMVTGSYGGITKTGGSILSKLAKSIKGGNLRKLANTIYTKSNKFVQKVTPDIAEPDVGEKLALEFLKKKGHNPQGIVAGNITKFGKFLEDRSRKKLYKTLATKDEFAKFQNTYPNLTISNEGFKGYKSWLKNKVYNTPVGHKVGEHFNAGSAGRAIGAFDPEERAITMASDLAPSTWGSTLRHELKHSLDFDASRFQGGDYGNLGRIFKRGRKPSIKNKIMKDTLIEPTGVAREARDFIQYMESPTEVLARTTQLKTKGIRDTVLELLGGRSKPRRELARIYDKDFIKTLMNKYWAGAPAGLAIDQYIEEDKYPDSGAWKNRPTTGK